MYVVLECSVCKNRNYKLKKSKEKASERLQLKKYCKTCERHTSHVSVG